MKKNTKLALAIGGITIAGVILQLTGFDVVATLTTAYESVKTYITSPEGNAFFMTALTGLNGYTLTANKLAQLKVADGQVQMMAQNVKIAELTGLVGELKAQIADTQKQIAQSVSMTQALMDINAVAFNQSRISDTAKQYIEKRRVSVLVKDTTDKPVKKGKAQEIVEQVVEQLPPIETILKNPLEVATRIAQKIANVE